MKADLRAVVATGDRQALEQKLYEPAAYDRRLPDTDLPSVLRKVTPKKDNIAAFIGKLTPAKGLQAVVLAAPLVLANHPKARFLIVGFGEDRELFEMLLAALSNGRGEIVDFLLPKIESQISPAVGLAFISQLKKRRRYKKYLQIAAEVGLADKFLFTGPLEHKELAELLPAIDVSVSPSIFPEALGMVSLEALACGVYSLVVDEFGLAEIRALTNKAVKKFWPGPPVLKVDNHLVFSLTDALIETLECPSLRQPEFKKALRRLAESRFSWDQVVEKYLKLSAASLKRR